MENKEESEDDGGIVTMEQVLRESENLEADSRAVLGGSDDTACSYPNGYVGRQALYSCKTCNPNADSLAGICLACSLTCHENHDLYELYTKRNFKCDCGNSKFPSGFKCQLYPDKEALNEANKYNQNFRGLYCTCSKPYPDSEDPVEDEMTQCCICEDWFHTRHVSHDGNVMPVAYYEMICPGCICDLPFIKPYSDPEKGNVEVSKDVTEADSYTPVCKLTGDPESLNQEEAKAVFMDEEWRSRLCQCTKCKELYKRKKCEFLLSVDDSVSAYEKKAQESGNGDLHSAGITALQNLDRVNQIEMLTEYNDLKESLSEYLKEFARTGKVVSTEDIETFFTDRKAKKRPRMDPPQNCHH